MRGLNEDCNEGVTNGAGDGIALEPCALVTPEPKLPRGGYSSTPEKLKIFIKLALPRSKPTLLAASISSVHELKNILVNLSSFRTFKSLAVDAIQFCLLS
jgi:hypothetical protein